MPLTINAQQGEYILSSFAKAMGSTVKAGRVNIPSKYGSGYVQGFVWGSDLRMIIRNYELKEDLTIQRRHTANTDSMIQIFFQNILKDPAQERGHAANRKVLPSVTITTQGLEPVLAIPGNTGFNAINLAIKPSYLKQLLDTDVGNTVLQNILDNSQPLLFEQLVSAELQQIASEITDTHIAQPLQGFYYKLKAEELICYLLMELVKREDSSLQSINAADVKALYAAKDRLISDLAEAPSLKALSLQAGMSESKLRRLFRQVFGTSIYDYYQAARMREAAYLLREVRLSVSEAGYQLGFSNLSHFTRVFEAYIGMKPKKYSASS